MSRWLFHHSSYLPPSFFPLSCKPCSINYIPDTSSRKEKRQTLLQVKRLCLLKSSHCQLNYLFLKIFLTCTITCVFLLISNICVLLLRNWLPFSLCVIITVFTYLIPCVKIAVSPHSKMSHWSLCKHRIL